MNKQANTYKFLISGGGTGGHIFPALSIADELKKRFPGAEIRFVGALGRMEMERVPKHGYPITGLPIAGLQRKFSAKNLLLPFKTLSSLWKAYRLLRRFGPDAVIGTGGYASLPLLWTAQRLGIPTYIQEQNSYPGITNKILAKHARKIFAAYDEAGRYFPAGKVVLTGNPVRAELKDIPPATDADFKSFGLYPALPVVMILGGSLGSAAINKAVASWVEKGLPEGVQLLWQTGKLYYDRYRNLENERVRIVPFIENMQRAFAVADVIVSRAGAGTLSELALAGKPVILVPSPNVAEDHQTKNARAFANKGAAILLPETQLNNLPGTVEKLLSDEDARRQMGRQIRKLARPGATQHIVDEIIKDLARK